MSAASKPKQKTPRDGDDGGASPAAGENGWADYPKISQGLSAAALRALSVKS